MNMMSVFKMISKMILPAVSLSLCACIYTKSGNTNYNRDIEIMVTSGKAYIDISGHISEDIYFYNDRKDMPDTAVNDPVVMQGKRTINKQIILGETQRFKYTLTTAEAVIMNIKSVDDHDVLLTVFEHGSSVEHTIDGKNKLGQTISFKN